MTEPDEAAPDDAPSPAPAAAPEPFSRAAIYLNLRDKMAEALARLDAYEAAPSLDTGADVLLAMKYLDTLARGAATLTRDEVERGPAIDPAGPLAHLEGWTLDRLVADRLRRAHLAATRGGSVRPNRKR